MPEYTFLVAGVILIVVGSKIFTFAANMTLKK